MDGATEPRSGPLVEAGGLPPWGKGDLQAPPPYSIKNALRVTGAGAIILGISIGSGEWLIGPAVTAQFTAALLWVATTSILLQWVFNADFRRLKFTHNGTHVLDEVTDTRKLQCEVFFRCP